MPLPHWARKTAEPEWVPLGADGKMLPRAKVKQAVRPGQNEGLLSSRMLIFGYIGILHINENARGVMATRPSYRAAPARV